MHIVHTFGHLFGAILLIAGTSIGVGMLALPVATAAGGFLPSLIVYSVCWLFMLTTGLLILEACIWMPSEANLITLSAKLLGRWGKACCWVLYLFLFTCLMIAHISGGGSVVEQISNNTIPYSLGLIFYTLAFAPAVYLGTLWVDRLNIILMAGIAIAYLAFIYTSISHIQPSLLLRIDFPKAWLALPVVFTAFGYQSLIPTLMTYLNRNVKKMRLAIIFGTSIPFAIYLVWQFLILGIIPLEGSGGLAQALKQGENAVEPLGKLASSTSLHQVGQAFAFFALTTSFIGISIAYVDFLADGCKIQKKGIKKLGLCAIVFVLPMIISLINPQIFLESLSYAGGIGVALLLGAMPVLMVWSGRYFHGYSLMHQQIPGGKILLSFLLLFVVFELIITFIR